MRLSLKMFYLRIAASFADHHRLHYSLVSFQWTNEAAMASFQLEKYIQLAIDTTGRLTYH